MIECRVFLVRQLHIAVNLGAKNKKKENNYTQEELWWKVRADQYMEFAIKESFLTLEQLLLSVLRHNDKALRW